MPAKTLRTKQPHKNPNEIHQFTNSQIYRLPIFRVLRGLMEEGGLGFL
jgi:hypothetical protein